MTETPNTVVEQPNDVSTGGNATVSHGAAPGPQAPRRRSVPGRNWDRVREDYLSRDVGLRQLAQDHGIPYPTIRDRCMEEGWAIAKSQARTALRTATSHASHGATVKVIENAVSKAAATAALSASALVQRTLKESDRWLDRINEVSDTANARNPDAIRKLTGSWKDVISVARLTHGLDATGTTVNVAVFSKPQRVEAEPIEVQVVSSLEHNT